MSDKVTLIEHGTAAGWQHCRRAPSGPCGPCRAAHSGYMTAWRHRTKLRAKAVVQHGTEAALITHWAWDENPCELCQSWHRAYLRGLALEGLR